jgi:hypothetical protein
LVNKYKHKHNPKPCKSKPQPKPKHNQAHGQTSSLACTISFVFNTTIMASPDGANAGITGDLRRWIEARDDDSHASYVLRHVDNGECNDASHVEYILRHVDTEGLCGDAGPFKPADSDGSAAGADGANARAGDLHRGVNGRIDVQRHSCALAVRQCHAKNISGSSGSDGSAAMGVGEPAVVADRPRRHLRRHGRLVHLLGQYATQYPAGPEASGGHRALDAVAASRLLTALGQPARQVRHGASPMDITGDFQRPKDDFEQAGLGVDSLPPAAATAWKRVDDLRPGGVLDDAAGQGGPAPSAGASFDTHAASCFMDMYMSCY